MDEPTPEPETPEETPEGDTRAVRRLERDVSALISTADQLGAEIHALDITLVLFAFAFGALAGLVYLNSREIRELADALPG